MQATYCDLCGKRISGKITQAEMPRLFKAGNPWIATDMCDECVGKLIEFCKGLEEGNNGTIK